VGLNWNCEAAGLIVNAGDHIVQKIEGSGQGFIPDPITKVGFVSGDGYVRFSWFSVPNADSYNIYGGTEPDFIPNASTLLANAVIGPFVLGGLVNNQTYYFYMTAINNYGESAVSDQVSATPVIYVPPPPPPFPNPPPPPPPPPFPGGGGGTGGGGTGGGGGSPGGGMGGGTGGGGGL